MQYNKSLTHTVILAEESPITTGVVSNERVRDLCAGSERLAYSGDTGWFDDLPARVAGADLFVTECTYHTDDFEYHLNYQELSAHGRGFDCGRIILTHLGTEMTDRRGQCASETADDGLVIQI